MTKELTVVSIHPGVTRQQVQENCGWAIKFTEQVNETPVPTEIELSTLRDINPRTKEAHQGT